ncbi:MAG: hypothetical protein JXR37_21460 [Kiritimatiellae bacterium]|nr:hypothetical protein [Kiritimatiellia bacterium]
MPLTEPKPNAGFATEGHFVALPLGMPNEAMPIPPDECRIAHLAASADGHRVYGATSGAASHVFVSLFKGSCGALLDLGVVPGAARIPVVAEHRLEDGALAVNLIGEHEDGAACHRFCWRPPANTIQEPPFPAPSIVQTGALDGWHGVSGAIVRDADLVCLADKGLAFVSLATGVCRERLALAAPAPVSPPFLADDGRIVWLAADGALRRLEPGAALETLGRPRAVGAVDACCRRGRELLAAGGGEIRGWDMRTGRCALRGRIAPPPVQCMTALPDGRVYGVCGAQIGHLFRLERDGTAHDLGVIASVLGAIRHGFEFACALTTAEGVVCLGEHDRGGHLWMYFPAFDIPASKTGARQKGQKTANIESTPRSGSPQVRPP